MSDVLVVNLFERCERALQGKARAEENLIRALYRRARGGREAPAPEADCVQAAHARGVSVRGEERENVLHDLRLPSDHRVPAEAHELVRADVRGGEGVVFDCHVARERRAVREHVVVAYEAVARAYARLTALAARAVDGRVLANQVVVANDERASLALELHVLRLAAER